MMMFLRRSTQAELDAFYPIRPECQDSVPKPRFKLRTGKTLSARRWHASFSEEGQLDIAKVLKRIQRGGVHPSIRGAVWEFLLGCYDPNSTFDDRSLIRQRRREQYDEWKAACQKMVPVIGSGKFLTTPIVTDDGQPIDGDAGIVADENGNNDPAFEKKVIQWKQVLPQIGLDVVRTDQPLVFYQTESNQAKLWNILSIYAWVDSDISYVQGMNDICSPMVILLENEADAYWCFARAMRRLRDNFKTTSTSIGVQARLSTLSAIIKVVDPKLHEHLEELDGGEYLFAFRMLMVLFRREFSFMDALYLWELMWAMEYNPNTFLLYETSAAAETTANVSEKLLKQYGKFERNNVRTGCKDYQSALAVFLAASILENKHKRILKEAKGLDDVVEILGDVTGNLDAKKACKEALNIQKKFLKKEHQGTYALRPKFPAWPCL
ncbi:rab GTPase-activating protein 22-like isoform X2 [Amaranthus tricolor]|uniref:rab GTPase-activating protein 22-like isoform X2 n=1 Tax=Amaranthus tricolor TaxID=29722 RepID=UPI00258F8B36|nr:rab GTPase-activating protein 22-like isoform X2 [Amaranthus tricolor]